VPRFMSASDQFSHFNAELSWVSRATSQSDPKM